MKKRIPMNSDSLKEYFPEIYREFFSKCPIVTSAPGNFWWSGEYAVLYGGLAIKQNLPLRVYVGFEPNNEKIKIGTTKIYVPSKGKFEERPTPNIMGKRIIEFLTKSIPKEDHNFTLHIIYEVPVGCGLAASSALSAALALAIKTIINRNILNDLDKIKSTPIKNLINNQLFNEIFRLAWKADNLFHDNTSSGAGPFASLVDSNFPVVYFTEKRKGLSDENSDYLKIWGFRIDELVNLEGKDILNLEKLNNWPIDFGLIYTGDAGSTEASIQSTKIINWQHRDINLHWQKIFKNLDVKEKQPLFYHLTKSKEEDNLVVFIESLTKISLETLWSLVTVFKYGFSDEDFRFLFRAINRNQDMLKVIQISSPILDTVCQKFLEESVKGTGIGGGAKLTGAGKRGDILFVVPFHGIRDHIDHLLKDTAIAINEDTFLDYASWLDGTEPEGMKIEQFLKKGINSKFVSDGSVILKNWNHKGIEKIEILSLEDYREQKKKIDLLLDNREGDIYIRGRKLSSKDVPSSSTAVETILILLENLGKEINNNKIPESSYSLDRNEMQSKIVSPLIRVVKKYTNKDLPLEIHGGITNFYLKINFSNLNIKVLDKI